MRKLLIYQIKLTAVLLVILLNIMKAPAQNQKSDTKDSRNHDGHTQELTKPITTKTKELKPEPGSEILQKSFRKYFPQSSNPSWITKENVLLAYFSNKGTKQMACFSANGVFIYSIRHFERGQFPKYLCGRVLTAYTDYSINNIKEVRTSDSYFHEFLMESNSDYVLLQLVDDELIRIKTISKSKTDNTVSLQTNTNTSNTIGKD